MGYRVGRRESAALRELASELAVLRPGHDTVNGVLPEIRRLLGTETLVVLSPVLRGSTWELERLHLVGFARPQQFADTVLRFFREAPRRYAWYDAVRPESAQRNRVIEAHQLINPGELERSAIYERWLYPERLHTHRQPRVLLCDGPVLLAWFGAFHSGPVEPRHRALMQCLIEPLRRRLAVERQVDTCGRDAAVLAVVLGHLGAAAWTVDAAGRIHECNGAGRALLDTRGDDVRASLTAAIAGRPSALAIELMRVEVTGMPDTWLAISREQRDARIDACVAAASVRWHLSRRQREVLSEVVHGRANVTIALSFGITERAVEQHVSAILERADISNRCALVAAVLLIEPDDVGSRRVPHDENEGCE